MEGRDKQLVARRHSCFLGTINFIGPAEEEEEEEDSYFGEISEEIDG